MKAIFHKSIATILTLLLLASTVSWSIDKHLCMGRVMDIAFFDAAEDCGMEAAAALLAEEGIENHCCDNESFTLKGQEDLRLDFSQLELPQQFFLFSFLHSYTTVLELSSKEIPPNTFHPPPKLIRDIQLLDEVFLI